MTNGQNPKRQRQKEARRLKLEQERKAALARKRKRTYLILGVLAIAVATVFFRPNQGDDPEAEASPTPTAEATPTPSPPTDIAPADPTKPQVAVTTSEGELQIELAADISPNLVQAFTALVEDGFYDGLIFHRIVRDFAIQGGDPTGTGTGGPDESTVDPIPTGFRYVRGTVAMAKTGAEPAGTAGSQFFIVPADSAADRLTPEYAVLGRVVSGLDTVDRLNAVEVGPQDRPVSEVTIEKIEIIQP